MSHLALRSLVLGLLLALASGAHAKEESKLQILLLPPGMGGGNGNGNGLAKGQGPIGDLRSFLQDPGSLRRLQLHVRGLEPSVEHALLALLDESDPAPAELCRFTTDANGQWKGTCDIGKGDAVEAPIDPRGKYLVVNDGTQDVLAGWLYGAPEDDGPMTKVKEQTRLAPDETADPTGSADARYDMRPNGKGSLVISLRGVPAGDYDVYVDGVLVETLTPNPGGAAKATFRTHPSNGNGGNGKGHNKRGLLDFDPRRKLVELKQGTDVYFSGPMLAQIEGLNVCTPSSTPIGNVTPAGLSATLELDESCETVLVLSGSGFAEGTYDLSVDTVDVADVMVAADGLVDASFGPGDLPAGLELSGTSAIVLTPQP